MIKTNNLEFGYIIKRLLEEGFIINSGTDFKEIVMQKENLQIIIRDLKEE